jgi:HEAT repeat protein
MMFRQRRINAKVRVLSGHTETGVRRNAARVLGRFGDPRAVGPLTSALNDSDIAVRVEAVEALARLGPAGVQALVDALYGNRAAVCQTAARCLGTLGWQPETDVQRARLAIASQDWDRAAGLGTVAVEPLIAALAQTEKVRPHDMAQQALAMSALVRVGTAATEPLIAALADTDGDVRKAAVKALGQLYDTRAAAAPGEPADPRATRSLISMLDDTNGLVREAAAQALGKLGDQQATGPLIAALNPRSDDLCIAAVQALGRLHDPRAAVAHAKSAGPRVTGPLIAVVTSHSPYPRKAAAEVLGDIGDARTVEPLIAAARVITADQQWSWGSDSAALVAAVLIKVVERSLPDISVRTLHKLETLDDIRWTWDMHEDNVARVQGHPASLAEVRQLASQELARRATPRSA